MRSSFKLRVIMYALKYNANHSAVKHKVSANTVRRWLRDVGLERAINSYYFKRKG